MENKTGSMEGLNSNSSGSLIENGASYERVFKMNRYHITVHFDDDAFFSDEEPLRYLEEVASYGRLIERRIDKKRLPSFENFDPLKCYISWSCIIETGHGYAVFEEIFMNKEHSGTYSIEELQPVEDIDHGQLKKNPQYGAVRAESSDSEGDASYGAASAAVDGVVVDSKRLDLLMNLLGEIVIGHSSISRFAEGLEVEASLELKNAMYGLDRTTREFQEHLMAIRTIQMGAYLEQLKTFGSMKAEEYGKNIVIDVEGHETELDRTMMETLIAPVRDIIEFAIKISVEDPHERKEADKHPTGALLLKAYHQEGSVVFEIFDDGRGLDARLIKKQAEELGTLKKGEEVSKSRIFSCLLNEDFTKVHYPELGSLGRSLKQVVENLRGVVDIDSSAGRGTTFRIKLPLSLAIIEGMAVRVGEQVYIIPLLSIVESIQPKKEDIKTIEGKGEVIQARGEYLALVRLYQYYNIISEITNPWESLVVIVESNGEKVGLMVDDLIGQQQIVIKNLGSDIANNRSISGASILGDGRISLIIDIHGLVEEITV